LKTSPHALLPSIVLTGSNFGHGYFGALGVVPEEPEQQFNRKIVLKPGPTSLNPPFFVPITGAIIAHDINGDFVNSNFFAFLFVANSLQVASEATKLSTGSPSSTQ